MVRGVRGQRVEREGNHDIDENPAIAVNQLSHLVNRQFEYMERMIGREENGNNRNHNSQELSCERFRRMNPPTFDGSPVDPMYAE